MYKDLGDKAIILIDERIIQLAQFVRERFNKPVTINNWYYGGEYKYRGVRPHNCKVGAKYSQHKSGRAFDFTVEGISIKELHQDIVDFWNKKQEEDKAFKEKMQRQLLTLNNKILELMKK